jgi:hypothetical protein
MVSVGRDRNVLEASGGGEVAQEIVPGRYFIHNDGSCTDIRHVKTLDCMVAHCLDIHVMQGYEFLMKNCGSFVRPCGCRFS